MISNYPVMAGILVSMVNLMGKLIPFEYGECTEHQLDFYKRKLQKKIFWLIIYTDLNTCEPYKDFDVLRFHKNLIEEFSSFNSIFDFPDDFLEVVNCLNEALIILESEHFDFKKYRKLVLDAGALLKSMEVGD